MIEDEVGVDPGDRVGVVVHVRLLDFDQHLLADLERHPRSSIAARVPDTTTSKVSIALASPPSKWNRLPVSSSSSVSPLSESVIAAAAFA